MAEIVGSGGVADLMGLGPGLAAWWIWQAYTLASRSRH
jgi:hypothetical protein